MNVIGDAEKPLTEAAQQAIALIAALRGLVADVKGKGLIITIRVTPDDQG